MRVLLLSLQKNLNILGLKLLHQILLDNGHESGLLYINRFQPNNNRMLKALKDFIKDYNPAWIGISLTASEFSSARDITVYLKQSFNIPIIWGGVQATADPIRCTKYADFVCIGEAEKTVIDICNAICEGKSLKTINNMSWMEKDEIIQNPLNPLIQDLNQLPFVPRLARNAYILFNDKVQILDRKLYMRYSAFRGGIYRIVSSRGCPFRCSYCLNSFFDKLYPDWSLRWTSPEHIIDEICAGVSEDIPLLFISMQDDNFFAQKKETIEKLFALYKERVNKPFIILSTPNFITEDKLKLAVDAGLSAIHIGLQSGCERISHGIYNRVVKKEQFLNVTKIVNKYPVVPYYDIICDNPYETEEDELETIRTLSQIPKPYFFLLFSLTLYEGTDLRERVKKENPEFLHDDTEKDFLIPSPTKVNLLKHLATIYPSGIIELLIKQYQKNPDSYSTHILFLLFKYTGFFLIKPIVFLWILLKFNHYSIFGFIKTLPRFIDFRIINIFNFFHTSHDTTIE
ncbi:MAG: B12-binding domain-containing radical SAM protein [Candidatus Hydrogenedens sp.]